MDRGRDSAAFSFVFPFSWREEGGGGRGICLRRQECLLIATSLFSAYLFIFFSAVVLRVFVAVISSVSSASDFRSIRSLSLFAAAAAGAATAKNFVAARCIISSLPLDPRSPFAQRDNQHKNALYIRRLSICAQKKSTQFPHSTWNSRWVLKAANPAPTVHIVCCCLACNWDCETSSSTTRAIK